jgi:heme-degrading monooxygenase HmoA
VYIAMNRFKVARDRAQAFEAAWIGRDSRLRAVPGFVAFHLLKGPEADDHVLYASHTTWASREAFEDWTRSEAFRAAHRDAGGTRDLYLEPPRFEGFAPVQTITADDEPEDPGAG